MPPSREDQIEYGINGWYAANDGICPTCKRDLKLLKPESNIYPHFMALCNDEWKPEVYVEKYNRKPQLIMRIVAIPFTIAGNLLNWWRSR